MNTTELIEWWKSNNWNDITSYYEYLNNLEDRNNRIINDDLCPDIIDNEVFWKACEQHFGIDAVSNRSNTKRDDHIKEGNFQNLQIFNLVAKNVYDVAINTLNRRGLKSIVEIGPGYGCLQQSHVIPPNFTYSSFDVYPRIENCKKLKSPFGLFSDEDIIDIKENVGLVLSINVYQHLTPKQLKNHIDYIYKMLSIGGYAIITYVANKESYLYGQCIQLLPFTELQKYITDSQFTIMSEFVFYPDLPGHLTPTSLLIKKDIPRNI